MSPKALIVAISAVAYVAILLAFMIAGGPSMRPDGICCDEGIGEIWWIGWMLLGLGAWVYFLATEVSKMGRP